MIRVLPVAQNLRSNHTMREIAIAFFYLLGACLVAGLVWPVVEDIARWWRNR